MRKLELTEMDIMGLMVEVRENLSDAEMHKLAMGYIDTVAPNDTQIAAGGFLAGVRWTLEHLSYKTDEEMQ